MSYIKACKVLPEELLELIQEYIDGEYIYIPRKEGNKKAWGEETKSKKAMGTRNAAIFEQHKKGVRVEALSQQFFLSGKRMQINSFGYI